MSQRWRGGFSQRSKAARAPGSKNPCVNPIFESWIMEWKEEAEAKDSNMKYVYAKALNSLRKYPLPISSGKECAILENFGSYMCQMIENRMSKENASMFPGGSQSTASQGISDVTTLSDLSQEPGPSSKITVPKKQQKTTTVKYKTPAPNVDQAQPSTSRKNTVGGKKANPIAKLSSHAEVVDLIGSDSELEPQPSSSNKVAAPKKKRKGSATSAEVMFPTPRFDMQEFIETNTEFEPAHSTKAKQQKGKPYLPAYRSGAYAILIALLNKEGDSDYRGYMTKSELQTDAQRYCDSSMTKPDSKKNSHYTAWNSMKILTKKELVMRRGGNPVLFYLTPEGRSLAKKLEDAEKDSQVQRTSGSENMLSDNELLSQDDEDCDVVSPSGPSTIRLEPGKFEIVLYVDTCETNGPGKSQDVINELQKNGVTIYVHRLNIGDFVWVCREVTDVSGNRNRLTISRTNELILSYVVERKRTDDLAHSIRDGRFHEQKFRLRQTKLQPIYLIESYGKGDWGLAEGALERAIANTQIEDGFLIQETSSIKDTCAYLTFMTRHLKDTYEHKTIFGCRREDWTNLKGVSTKTEAYMMFLSDVNDFSVKKTNWKVKEMFARHLMRLKGLSVDKAFAIIQKYPTLGDLLKAYSEFETEKEKENLLSKVEFGTSCRKIGPKISHKVYRFYNSTNLS
ncbi:unnamed protein product [Orchesella dallaii]|uniref:Crossover junction endonuclease MUS81 n=1 Tax=Orchesella dallaii TaxID=48710 RepID=A0ABP1Q0Q9_9HEXA